MLMSEKEFLDLKEKINLMKRKSIEASGKLEAITEKWERDYGFKDINSAKKKLEELKADSEIKTRKRDELMEKLEKLVDEKDN
jgi:hypothetical protein